MGNQLIDPARLWYRSEVLGSPSPVPREPGVYAWYFREIPLEVPTEGCHRVDGSTLLYIGIAPKAPPRNGTRPSKQRLFDRVRYHYRGNAEGSTLRLTLGCLLADNLGIQLRRVGSGKRFTFGGGEHLLSAWMAENALVTWTVDPEPWVLEEQLIGSLTLPLNLDMNSRHPFFQSLRKIRKQAKEVARELPILT